MITWLLETYPARWKIANGRVIKQKQYCMYQVCFALCYIYYVASSVRPQVETETPPLFSFFDLLLPFNYAPSLVPFPAALSDILWYQA